MSNGTLAPATITPRRESRVFGRQLMLLLVVAVVAIFAFNGKRPLYDTSEARYSEVAREMAVNGNWLVPHLLDHPHLTKPPLAYWIVAASIRVFGTGEWAVRLPVGLFFLLQILIVWDLARTLWRSEAVGVLAGWLMLLSVFPLGAAHTVTTDVFLSAIETAGIWCLWRTLRAPSAARGWASAFWIVWGAAFMTKGPPALLPLLPVLLFAWITRGELPWRRLRIWYGPLLFLAVALPWYIAVLVRVPHALAVWKFESVNRMVDQVDRQIPVWHYLAVLALGTLPATAALPRFFRQALAERKSSSLSRESLFLILWFLVPLVIFCISRKRLWLYVLPLAVPLVIAAARTLEERWMPEGGFSWGRIPRWAKGLAVAILAAAVVGRYWYATFPEPLKSFKPLAEVIARDAAQRHARPSILLTTGQDGLGLIYYLGGPPVLRLDPSDDKTTEPGGRSRNKLLAQAFESPVPDGFIQYAIIRAKDQRRYQNTFDGVVDKELHAGSWVAWRRLSNAPQHVELTPDKGAKVAPARTED